MKKILIAVALILIANQIVAQNFKFGKVSKEELEEKVYPLDSSANAAVLFKNRRTYFNYVQGQGFMVVTEETKDCFSLLIPKAVTTTSFNCSELGVKIIFFGKTPSLITIFFEEYPIKDK